MDPESYVHRFWLFYRDSRMEAGWIEGLQKHKLVIHPLQGKIHILAPNRLLFHWKGAPPDMGNIRGI